MTTQIGNQEDFLFTEETVYGDGGDFASTKFRMGVNQALTNPNFSMNWRYIRGGNISPNKKVVGEKAYAFTLEWTLNSGKFLKYVTKLDTETGSNPYVHTLLVPKNECFNGSSFAFQRVVHAELAYLFSGVKINKFSINFAKGADEQGLIKISADCIAQNIIEVDSVDIETLAFEDRQEFIFNSTRLVVSNTELFEVNNGNYNFDYNVNPDQSRYCNATLRELIGEPIYAELTQDISININNLSEAKTTEFLARDELENCRLEFVNNETNNKLVFNFELMYNEGNLPPTQFSEVTTTDIVYTPILNNIVITDDIQNY